MQDSKVQIWLLLIMQGGIGNRKTAVYVYIVVFFNLKIFKNFDIINYKVRKERNYIMKIKDIIILLSALDDELDVKFIDLYGVGIEIMTTDEEFYYSEMED